VRVPAPTTSADFCPVTPRIAAPRAAPPCSVRCLVRSRGSAASPHAWALFNQRTRLVIYGARKQRCRAGQISPNKFMSFRCTTAAFTLPLGQRGLRHLVPTRPGTEPSMQFLFVGSHLCTWASFRQFLADLPLPSASGYPDLIVSSHRGLSPHKLMPMSGVHHALHRTLHQRRFACWFRAGEGRRSTSLMATGRVRRSDSGATRARSEACPLLVVIGSFDSRLSAPNGG